MYNPIPRRKPREAAQCKHPFALHPGLSQIVWKRTKEITKETNPETSKPNRPLL